MENSEISIKRKFKIASRSSALALEQVYEVIELLCEIHSNYEKSDFEIIEISNAEGDINLKDPLYAIGSIGLFTKSVEKAILEKEADFCVHSLKDLPTELDAKFILAAIPKFAPRADVVILKEKDKKLVDLPVGSILGTSSLRRISGFKEKHPNLELRSIRGNLNTRFKKLFEGNEYSGIILAEAGVSRLGFSNLISERLDPEKYLYAPGQGALGIECLAENNEVIDFLKQIDDYETRRIVESERQFLNVLEGGCRLPIGVFSQLNEGTLRIIGQVWDYTGQKSVRKGTINFIKEIQSSLSDQEIGKKLAIEVLEDGGKEILDLIRGK